MGFTNSTNETLGTLAFLNSSVTSHLIKMLAPTLDFKIGHVLNLPFIPELNEQVAPLAQKAIHLSAEDWSNYEASWDFKINPYIAQTYNKEVKGKTLSAIHCITTQIQDSATEKLKQIEETINAKFISAFMLEGIDPAVSLEKVSLNGNPAYRYSGKSKLDIYSKRTSDSTSELVSFALGCMMGRYSLDREGLVYAHSGNQGFKELVAEGAYKTFPADDDGIIPMAAEEWLFQDDATSRFRDFVKTVWGEEHLQENLDFVAESLYLDAIKPKKNERTMDTIRRYFSSQFYKDHLKTYKKRPIYWLFSSGKEKAFECLVYLHRYNESTLARMRTEYVTPLMGRMESQYSVLEESRANASGAEQRRIDKELKSIEKKQSELRAFDEELKHLAEMKISIDLDDGVKVNYGKFGNLLADVKAIHGKKPEAIK